MKILESIIWLSDENRAKLREWIPGFIPVIEGEIASSVRMPFNNKFVWNFYLLDPDTKEDVYLYQHFEESVLSHIFLLNSDTPEVIENAEKRVESFTNAYEKPPICFFHFLNSESDVSEALKKTYWKLESGIYFTWQKKFLPLSVWNRISLDYYEKLLTAT